ncbi:MAG: cobalamin-dependent protein [Deltaproteobacteria bacterium]|nr:cobalamin-dependent protein [Deltaproteobacteria bacterium]
MKVMLLNPTERRIVQANLPLEIESVRGRNQPVGLLYVAAAARSVPGVTVEVLDAHALGLDAKGIERAVAASKPDVIGLTSVTFNLPDVIDCVAAVKRAHPSAYVALGGMQPYLYPEETLALPGVDGLFLGEAETSFPAFLRHFRDADKLRGVPGLMVRVGARSFTQASPRWRTIWTRCRFPRKIC